MLSVSRFCNCKLKLADCQGHNFGQKVGLPIQKDNEALLGPETKREENEEEVYPLLIRLGGWESVVSSPSRVRGGALKIVLL